jgi:hypothetical protein
MTKKEAIAKVRKSGTWTESEAISIVENEIKKNPDYLEEVRLVDVEKHQKKSKEPKEQETMDSSYEIEEFHPGPDRMGDIKNLVDSLGKAINLGLGSDKDKPSEGIEMYEGFGRDEDTEERWDDDLTNEQKLETLEKELNIGEDDEDRNRFADPEETDEERLERQIDYFNSLRDHVSDSDMGYMQQQDPESLYSQGRDVDNTMIVEALQRRAMEQGNVGATANMPFDPGSVPSQGVYNQPNPMIPNQQNQGFFPNGRKMIDVPSSALMQSMRARQNMVRGGLLNQDMGMYR